VLRQNPRLWFGGEGTGEDARSQTEDLGDNSVKASEYGIRNLKRVMENLPQWTHEDNDQYEDLTMMYNEVLTQFRRYQNHVLKNIGSYYSNNMPGQEPRTVAPKSRQKEAVKFIGSHVFDAPEWLYPTNIYNKVGTDAYSNQTSRQDNAIERMLDGYVLNKLLKQAYDNKDPYPVEEYLNDVFAEVWKPLNDASEWKNRMRRSLQRSYLAQIDKLVNVPEKTVSSARTDLTDVGLYVLQHLDKLEQYLKSQSTDGTSLNALHYQDLLQRIKLIRDRRTTVK
jgi:hypothetical protein